MQQQQQQQQQPRRQRRLALRIDRAQMDSRALL